MLTKSKRHEYYRAALIFVQSDIHHTLCWSLLKVSGLDMSKTPEEFPEIVSMKPQNRSTETGLWWDKTREGQEERIKVMVEAIKKTSTRHAY